MFLVERFVLGELQSNSYILHNNKFAIIIDPGAQAKVLLKFLELHNLSLTMVLLTHGHFDHVGAVKEIYEAKKSPVYIHEDDLYLYKRAVETAKQYGLVVDKPPLKALKFLIGNEDLDINGNIIRVLHTPGHTPGGLSFFVPSINTVFTGDLIFKGTVGRTDFEGSSFMQLSNSIRSQIYTLDNECKIYAGHGATTTVGEEKQRNEFIKIESTV